jgi:hypothetical protein
MKYGHFDTIKHIENLVDNSAVFCREKKSESGRTFGPFEKGCRWFQLLFIDFQLFYFRAIIIPDY